MKISYVVGTSNEAESYIKPLLDRILLNKDPEDQVIVLDDYSTNEETLKVLRDYVSVVEIYKHKLEGDFSAHRNWIHQYCKGDWVCMLDADETVSDQAIKTYKEIIENNPTCELYYMSRVNIVHGLTPEYATSCGWQVNEQGFINWPDLQGRLYKLSPDIIKWDKAVHERIVGTNFHSTLPYTDDLEKPYVVYSILHVKDVERQKKQNSLYNNILQIS